MNANTVYRRIKTGFLALLVFGAFKACAQDEEPLPETLPDEPAIDIPASVQAGIGFIVGFPVGQFGDNITNPGVGIGGQIGYRVPNSPLILGLDLAYIIYGRESRRERFSLTIPDVTVQVITENSIFDGNFFLRLQPRNGIVRPYIDGLFGFHYLFTRTKIRDVPEPHGDDVASSTNFDDFVFTYGGGVGIMVQVYDGKKNRTKYNRSPRTVSIDLRLRYMDGALGDYLKHGAVIRSGGNVSLNVTSSETNLVTAYIGASVDF